MLVLFWFVSVLLYFCRSLYRIYALSLAVIMRGSRSAVGKTLICCLLYCDTGVLFMFVCVLCVCVLFVLCIVHVHPH